MPWYAKLGYTLGLALAIVMTTMSAMAHESAWNAKTIACLVLVIMIATGMALTTYYYHLHENDDQPQGGDDDSLTWLRDLNPAEFTR
jgi:hypothetical protein